jgi:hypothetical protein
MSARRQQHRFRGRRVRLLWEAAPGLLMDESAVGLPATHSDYAGELLDSMEEMLRSTDKGPEAASAADGPEFGKRPLLRFAVRDAVPRARHSASACRCAMSGLWTMGLAPSGDVPWSSSA